MASYETAENRFIAVGETTFAYRQLGQSRGTPLVLFMHFRGTMDHWDPALLNPLAQRRPVILIDNSGVGRSTGDIAPTFAEWAQNYTNVVRALGHTQVDVMGFSMGGCVAQMAALNAPDLVRRLILCGTIPSTGEGVVTAPLGPFKQLKAASSDEEQQRAFLDTMFAPSDTSQRIGRESLQRIVNARRDRGAHVDAGAAHKQARAFAKFMDREYAQDASYDRFNELKMPVLIANGAEDVLLPTNNSILMWKMLSHANAQLHLYPDSGHGFLFQYATKFAALVNDFLDDAAARSSRL